MKSNLIFENKQDKEESSVSLRFIFVSIKQNLYIPQILDGLYSAAADRDQQRENVASLYDKECFGAAGMNGMQTRAVNVIRCIGMTNG